MDGPLVSNPNWTDFNTFIISKDVSILLSIFYKVFTKQKFDLKSVMHLSSALKSVMHLSSARCHRLHYSKIATKLKNCLCGNYTKINSILLLTSLPKPYLVLLQLASYQHLSCLPLLLFTSRFFDFQGIEINWKFWCLFFLILSIFTQLIWAFKSKCFLCS